MRKRHFTESTEKRSEFPSFGDFHEDGRDAGAVSAWVFIWVEGYREKVEKDAAILQPLVPST